MTVPNTSIALPSSLCSYMGGTNVETAGLPCNDSHVSSLCRRPYASLGLVGLIVLRGCSHFLVEIAHPGGESLGHRGPSIGRGVWPGVGHTVMLSKGLMMEVTFCVRTATVSEVRAFESTAWSGLHLVEEGPSTKPWVCWVDISQGKSAVAAREKLLRELLFKPSGGTGSRAGFWLCWVLRAVCRWEWSWIWTLHTLFLLCKTWVPWITRERMRRSDKIPCFKSHHYWLEKLPGSPRVLTHLPVRTSDGWSDTLFAVTDWAQPVWQANNSWAFFSGFPLHDLACLV